MPSILNAAEYHPGRTGHFWRNMKAQFLAIVVAGLSTGFAQSQIPKPVSQTTTKNFPACGFSARFSGQPNEIGEDRLLKLSATLGGKPEKPAWMYSSNVDGVRRYEVAMCVCLQEPKLSVTKAEIAKRSFGTAHIDGVGLASESPMTEIVGGLGTIDRVTIGDESSCLMFQTVGATGTPAHVKDVTARFMITLTPLPKE